MKKTIAFLFSLMLLTAVHATATEFIELASDDDFSAEMLAMDDFESEDIFAAVTLLIGFFFGFLCGRSGT